MDRKKDARGAICPLRRGSHAVQSGVMPSRQFVSWAKFRVSAVSLVGLLILLTLVYLLTGGTLLSRRVSAYLYLPDGSGLERDAPVRVDGVDVGRVSSVRLSGSPNARRAVVVTMDVERKRLPGIPAASQAEISSDSMIGDRFVDITSHPSPNSLSPGGEIPMKEETEVMKAIDMLDLEKQMRELNALLADLDAGRGPVGQFVRGRQMYDDLVKRCAEIDRAFTAAVAATTAVGGAIYSHEMYGRLLDSAARIDARLASIESGKLLRDPAQYDSLRASVAHVSQSVAALRTGALMQSGDAYAGWNRSLTALIRQVDDFDSSPALNNSAAYESLTGMTRELGEAMREIRTHPEKFVRMTLF